MIQTIIFDLSEVLISGLLGIERPLAARLHLPEYRVLYAFGGPLLEQLYCGQISEDEYLERTIAAQGWDIPVKDVKKTIRENFLQCVPGMNALTAALARKYELVLLSDHAAEWIEYIRTVHPFLSRFQLQFYSYELKRTKQDPSTFQTVLRTIGREPGRCLFVDDRETNVSVARSVGIRGIVFTTTVEFARALERGEWMSERSVWQTRPCVMNPDPIARTVA